MKKLLIIIVILLILSSLVFAKLSDETLEEVEKLRFKHYWYGINDENCRDCLIASAIEWTRDFLNTKVEGNKLIVETQDGKWFIEMKKMKE